MNLLVFDPFHTEPRSRETQKWIAFLKGERADQTRYALANATPYVVPFRRIFKQEGVPENLFWLALIESSFRVDATSPTGAQGMFQFKTPTARAFGLKVSGRVDERNQPLLAARAAARYLAYLRAKFSSWELVLAAYHWGEGDLRRLMESSGARHWRRVKRLVPPGTRDYVGKIKAASIVGERHFANLQVDAQPGFYQVKKGDSLYGIARTQGVDLKALMKANGLTSEKIVPGQMLKLPGSK